MLKRCQHVIREISCIAAGSEPDSAPDEVPEDQKLLQVDLLALPEEDRACLLEELQDSGRSANGPRSTKPLDMEDCSQELPRTLHQAMWLDEKLSACLGVVPW